ncbi:MAG: dauA [Gammaproteobacteria bacterium]|nr:dauA [Gammaproteobacteria bacterium]
MLAIIEAYRAGLLKKNNWLPNITAGLIVGVVALPLAMAFAIASGVAPVQGLYTAIIAALVVGIFGGSRLQIAGPTGAFIVILAGITARYGVSGLQAATLMAGAILLFMGVMRLGSVIKFIPDPVIVGFTSGIGIIIFVGEWKDFFGLSVQIPLDAKFYQKLSLLFQALPHLNIATTLLGVLSIALVLITPKVLKKIPGPLVAMVIATVLQALFHFKNVATLGSAFGAIPQRLPHFQWPILSFSSILGLIGPAFTIALLGAIESLLSATAADGMAHTRHDSNQELIGQGLANILCPLFGGFAATGAIARTATNIRNGGNSPISAIVHSLLLLLILISLAPLANNIPLCCLAAILFVVSYNMSDIPHFKHMLKCAPRYDVIVLLLTFLLTIFTNLVIAVNIGVIFAMLFFIRRMNQAVSIEQYSSEMLQTNGWPALPADTLVYNIQGPFFFGAAEKIESALAATNTDPKAIIFCLKDVPFMDMTGLETFQALLLAYHQRGVKVYLCEANMVVQKKLEKVGMFSLLQGKKNFAALNEVIQGL